MRDPLPSSSPFAVVVNDDPTQLNVLSGLMRKAGLEPRAFTAAEAALADMTAGAGSADRDPGALPALVVTELYMPGIDGWRFCRLLRSPEYAAFNAVPILVVSATFAGEEAVRIAADLGAEAFLPSQLDGKRFVEQVRAILSGKRVRKPLRVLIVEADKTLAGILQKAFDAHGYRVDTALTVQAATDAFAKNTYDAAVLDYRLPDGTGDALLDAFRAARPDGVCIMLTTEPGPELALDWMKRGAAAYLRKPFEPEYLIELCARARRERALLRVQDLLELRTRELRKSEASLREAQEIARMGRWELELATNQLSWSDGIFALFEVNREIFSASYKAFLEFVHPDDRARVDQAYRESVESKKPYEIDHRLLMKSGRVKWVNEIGRTEYDDAGHPVRSVGTVQDVTERKCAEEALRESEERHRRIIESSSDGFLLRSKEIVIYANPAALKLFRANHPGDLIGKRYLDLVHPDDRALTAARVKRAIDKNWVAPPREHRILALDGQVVHVESIGGLIKHRGENQIFGVFRDITERARTKAALRKSEERYQRITEAITDYIYTVRVADGRAAQTTHGPGCLAVTGYRAQEYAEDPLLWVRMVAAEDRSGVEEQARRILSGEDAPPIEHRIVHKNGTLRWVKNTFVPLRDEHGVLVSYDGLIQDITERKRAEVALEEESRRRTVLLDNIPGCLALILKKDTREIVASNRLARELGAVPGQTCFKTCAMRDDNCPFCLAPTMWATGQLQRIEVEYRGKWYEGIWAPLTENLYVHYIFDISERKGAEAQNRQLQKAESLGRMAGAIAHHFNNQLGAVMGNLELAMVGLPLGAGAVEKLTEAIQAARRAAEVSGLMLTYLGQTRGKREPLDLSETCRQSLPMLKAALPQDVALNIELPSPGPTIRADAHQIQQVLTNLCTNAWEAVGDGRNVIHLIVKAVSAADIPAGPRFPSDWQPQETAYACLEVADAGCGIADNDIEKLFDPFYSTKFAGRGLGLPVALGIVRTHGGVIAVQSKPGDGSVFRVFFPVSTEAVPRPPEKADGAPEIEGGGTVLLVEDLDMLRNMAKSMLALLGFSVLEARDGVEALEVFRPRQGEIRFVLCDLTMPRMDGWETLAALRELAPGIPVILSSGHNQARVMDGDHPALPEAFLSKPYGFKELRDAIARALANKK